METKEETSKETSKKGRKRAIEVTEELLIEVERMAGQGLTQVQIAAFYGVTARCWDKTKNRDKRIREAMRKGKAKTIVEVSGILMEHIRSGSVPAAMFYLKTQARWSEKNSLTVKSNVKSTQPIYKIETNDPIEASKIYQSIMTGSYKDERNGTSQ